MYQSFTRAFSLLPRWAKPLAVGILIYCLYRFIASLAGYLILATLIGWALVLLPLEREMGRLESVTSIRPIGRLIDWLAAGARGTPGQPASQRQQAAPGRRAPMTEGDRRRRMAEAITAAKVQAVLDEGLLAQTHLTEEVARRVKIFVDKQSPGRPLSILVAGPAGSGRTSFAEALAAATALDGKANLVHVKCTTDADVDLSKIGAAVRGQTLPILLLDDFDRIAGDRHGGAFVGTLTQILDNGAIRGKRILRNAIVILTVRLDASVAGEAWRQVEQSPQDASLTIRRALSASGRLPDDIVQRVEIASILKPLGPTAQSAVIWKIFCAKALEEHGVTILEESIGESDNIVDFLISAQSNWRQADVWEAARFVRDAADEVLIEASRKNWRVAKARWDRRASRLCLEPVDPSFGSE